MGLGCIDESAMVLGWTDRACPNASKVSVEPKRVEDIVKRAMFIAARLQGLKRVLRHDFNVNVRSKFVTTANGAAASTGASETFLSAWTR
jgi:hypothetical protein